MYYVVFLQKNKKHLILLISLHWYSLTFDPSLNTDTWPWPIFYVTQFSRRDIKIINNFVSLWKKGYFDTRIIFKTTLLLSKDSFIQNEAVRP